MAGPDPYLTFSAREWAAKGDGAALDLSEAEVLRLRSLGDHLDLDEVRRIYLPLSRLLRDHVEAMQGLFAQRKKFLDIKGRKTPFVIGIAGSVAVGKSTTARVLQDLMRRWPSSPNVALVTTDGFLLPNRILNERDLMTRKGFPESYDRKALIRFLADIKAGRSEVHAPRYSHLVYDIVEGDQITVSAPDILIFEGLNVLQNPPLEDAGDPTPVASDYFDFSIYVDAAADLIETWYISRFMSLRETAFADPASFFHTYAGLSDREARATAERLWNTINLVNLSQNIRPTRARASMVLRKGENHRVEQVRLRRL